MTPAEVSVVCAVLFFVVFGSLVGLAYLIVGAANLLVRLRKVASGSATGGRGRGEDGSAAVLTPPPPKPRQNGCGHSPLLGSAGFWVDPSGDRGGS